MTDPNNIDDISELRNMVEELQAYSTMMDLSFDQRVQDAVEKGIEEQLKKVEDETYSVAFDEGYDAGREEAIKEFNKYLEEARRNIDETLDLHIPDHTG